MNYCKTCEWAVDCWANDGCLKQERLQGVKGSERRLVEESRSDGEQVGVEERSEEGRRVEEIGGAVELRGHIERKLIEARGYHAQYCHNGTKSLVDIQQGKVDALVDILEWLDDTAGQRSDLFNDPSLLP